MKAFGRSLVLLAVSAAQQHPNCNDPRVSSVATGAVYAGEPGTAGETPNERLAISVWYDLNAMCRGGHGDRPETEYACCVRTKVSSLLNNMGYCYRMGDASKKGRDGEWEKLRTPPTASCAR